MKCIEIIHSSSEDSDTARDPVHGGIPGHHTGSVRATLYPNTAPSLDAASGSSSRGAVSGHDHGKSKSGEGSSTALQLKTGAIRGKPSEKVHWYKSEGIHPLTEVSLVALTFSKPLCNGHLLVHIYADEQQFFIYQVESDSGGQWRAASLGHKHPTLKHHRLWWKPHRKEPTWVTQESVTTSRGRRRAEKGKGRG